MNSFISQSLIDQLVNSLDLVQIVSGDIALNKVGKNYIGLCPFHDEKTPSFFIDPIKKFYFCQGCKQSGNVIGYIREFNKVSFPDAIKLLCHKLGVPNPYQSKIDIKKNPYTLLDKVSKYFENQLMKSPEALAYLQSRNINLDIAKKFGIGYADDKWQGIVNAFKEHNERLIMLGVLAEKNGTVYDRYRNRIIFPIRDAQSRIRSFSSRIISTPDKCKYLNGPDSEIFTKSKAFYGLSESLFSIKKEDTIIVVEGFIDTIQLHSYGYNNVVACMGTAISFDQVQSLFRRVNNLVFVFDGDQAGVDALLRVANHVFKLLIPGRSVSIVNLPSNMDPDEYLLKYGGDAFREKLNCAAMLTDYLIDSLSKTIDLHGPEGQAKLVSLIVPFFTKVADPLYKELIINYLAKKISVSKDFIENYYK